MGQVGLQGVEVRRATAGEWRESRDLRLEMLADSPRSFLDGLNEVERWDDERWQARMRSHTAPDSVVIAAVADRRWVGQASGRIFSDTEPPRAYALAVYVSPQWRGRGLAARLVGGVGEWAAGLGIGALHLDVHEDARPAIASYLRQGFVFTGERSEHPNHQGEWELEMVRALR